jgi:hypothetical protein
MLYIQMYYSLKITKKRINEVSLDGVNFSAYNYNNYNELLKHINGLSVDRVLWFEHLNDLKQIPDAKLARFMKILIWDGVGIKLNKALLTLPNLLVLKVNENIKNGEQNIETFKFGSYLQSIESTPLNKSIIKRCVFYGGLHMRKGYHCNRINILYEAVRLMPSIELFIPKSSIIKDVVYCIIRPKYIPLFFRKLVLYSKSKGVLTSKDLSELRDAIVINIHVDSAHDYAVNLRILEALDNSVLIITNSYSKGDWLQDELLTFSNALDLVQSLSMILANPSRQEELKTKYSKLWDDKKLDFLFETKLGNLFRYLSKNVDS